MKRKLSPVNRLLKGWQWCKKIVLIGCLSSVAMVVVYKFIPVYFTPLMVIRTVEQIIDKEPLRWHHKWVSIDDISPNLVKSVIASEDNRFPDHWGFDWTELQKASQENKKGRRIRGGSTISQQTAKNVFLWPDRSWVRKGLEAYFTLLIELIWSKERIMEVYLNSIEMGKGIYGAESVAQQHFSTTAEKLTKAQAALIAVTLPNPRRFDSAHPTPYIYNRQKKILSLIPQLGKIELSKGWIHQYRQKQENQ